MIKSKLERIQNIPYGCYCYDIVDSNTDTPFSINIKPCSFFTQRKTSGISYKSDYCMLLHDFLAIDDGVKDCDINVYWSESDYLGEDI